MLVSKREVPAGLGFWKDLARARLFERATSLLEALREKPPGPCSMNAAVEASLYEGVTSYSRQ